jgi:hypothetical protein
LLYFVQSVLRCYGPYTRDSGVFVRFRAPLRRPRRRFSDPVRQSEWWRHVGWLRLQSEIQKSRPLRAEKRWRFMPQFSVAVASTRGPGFLRFGEVGDNACGEPLSRS